MLEQWNIVGGTVEQHWWNSVGAQWNSKVEQCGGTVEQPWWNSVVEQWNSHGGTLWWKSGTVMVEQWNSDGGTVEK